MSALPGRALSSWQVKPTKAVVVVVVVVVVAVTVVRLVVDDEVVPVSVVLVPLDDVVDEDVVADVVGLVVGVVGPHATALTSCCPLPAGHAAHARSLVAVPRWTT